MHTATKAASEPRLQVVGSEGTSASALSGKGVGVWLCLLGLEGEAGAELAGSPPEVTGPGWWPAGRAGCEHVVYLACPAFKNCQIANLRKSGRSTQDNGFPLCSRRPSPLFRGRHLLLSRPRQAAGTTVLCDTGCDGRVFPAPSQWPRRRVGDCPLVPFPLCLWISLSPGHPAPRSPSPCCSPGLAPSPRTAQGRNSQGLRCAARAKHVPLLPSEQVVLPWPPRPGRGPSSADCRLRVTGTQGSGSRLAPKIGSWAAGAGFCLKSWRPARRDA